MSTPPPPAGLASPGPGPHAAQTTEPPRLGKQMIVKVVMLDDTVATFQVAHKAVGQVLYDQCCKSLNLLECDYFGLEYTDECGCQCWLDHQKGIFRQIGFLPDPSFRFCVKFYSPDPGLLEEEYTRYLFALQIKRDLAQGRLHCNDATSALLASYIIQAECGDYSEEDYPDHTYLSSFKFVPHQGDGIERLIMDDHKKHIGQTPADADYNLLDIARRVELYGIRMHLAKDHEGVSLNLTVANMGVLVFQNITKINTFSWAKIRKLSFKRRKFLIKLHPDCYGYYKDTVEFLFANRNQCKAFWKKCIEHHAFFRCSENRTSGRVHGTKLFSKGSSFRYSGRTQKEVIDHVRTNYLKRQPFIRSLMESRLSGHTSNPPSVGTHHIISNATPSSGINEIHAMGDSGEEGDAAIHMPYTPHPPHQVGDTSSQGSRTMDSKEVSSGLATSETTTPSSPTIVEGAADNITRVVLQMAADEVRGEALLLEGEQELSGRNAADTRPVRDIPSPREPNGGINTNHGAPEKPTLGYNQTPPPPLLFADNKKNAEYNEMTTSYYISKELVMTERTYKKDLEVVTTLFARHHHTPTPPFLTATAQAVVAALLSLYTTIYQHHLNLLAELEQRVANWESAACNHIGWEFDKIGDIMCNHMTMLNCYEKYTEQLPTILKGLHEAREDDETFRYICEEIEVEKQCYLPINILLLKPLHRLDYYEIILEKLILQQSSDSETTLSEYTRALSSIRDIVERSREIKTISENFVQLVELQRDLLGVESLLQDEREFIREGCLKKLSKKGYHQRMFFLFSDSLIYTSRGSSPVLKFKIHGQIPVRGLVVVETDSKYVTVNGFTIKSMGKYYCISANSETEKERWIDELREAAQIQELKHMSPCTTRKTALMNTKGYASSSLDEIDSVGSSSVMATSKDDLTMSSSSLQKVGMVVGSGMCGTLGSERGMSTSLSQGSCQNHRTNTTWHVCWHRNTTITMRDMRTQYQMQLSGYLLRKFKNSNGWQKLWVVFTNFCLFFYKTFQDDQPLANLPLLGYTISQPDERDMVRKDLVFKLHFKNHSYFFKAESDYTYNRWLEVISSTTHSAARTPS